MTEYLNGREFALRMDKEDELRSFRDRFHIPKLNSKEIVYLCGNSLGLQPKTAREAIEQELKDWANLGVEGHVTARNPWLYYHKFLTEKAAAIVGAKKSEVVIMNNLTTNLHLMMVSFYRPTQKRFKILMEGGAFPSDQYAMESQVRFHGFDLENAIIEVHPRSGDHIIHHEDIIEAIRKNADDLALVMLGGVNYYTGQLFDMKTITEEAHKAGAMAGFDLAHAAGNVPLFLHDWDVDFAVWCSYKYLNSGPGGTSGAFVHERHGNDPSIPRFAGWWGHNEGERFQMKKGFIPMPGAEGWQLSNAQIFPMAIHNASLQIFAEAGMEKLRKKSVRLTGYLEYILNEINSELPKPMFKVITPADPVQRGCQLSLHIAENGKELFNFLNEEGIISDWREPNVIRMSPVPLYNSFEDVWKVSEALKKYINR